MFKNQIPQFPNFGRTPIPSLKPDLTVSIPELYPQPHDQPQGWGLTFMLTLHPGPTGRGSNTAHWAGVPNLFWWCDRERGVAGMICSQILPFGGKYFGSDIEIFRLIELARYRSAYRQSLGTTRVSCVRRVKD